LMFMIRNNVDDVQTFDDKDGENDNDDSDDNMDNHHREPGF